MANSNRNPRSVRASAGLPIGLAAVCLLALVVPVGQADAARGNAGSRGGMAQSSVSGANRSASANRASAGTANRANTGNVNTGRANTGNVNTGNVNTGNVNRGNVNTGNVNTGNINVGNDINIDIDADYGHWGGAYHPIARGAYIGAVAVTTAAVVGAYYYALPPSGCTVVIKSGVSYHYCGSVYYQQTWQGNDVVYVVVNP